MVPVVLIDPTGERDCEVEAAPAATVSHLLEALGVPGPLAVDGRLAPPEAPLASVLVAGAVLSTGTAPAAAGTGGTAPSDGAGLRFQVLAGPGSGMAVDLVPGSHVVGSGEGATIRLRARGVAPRHCRIEVDGHAAARLVTGTGTVPLDGDTVLVIGEALAAVAPAPESVRVAPGSATRVFNRRPRHPPPTADPPLVLPEPAAPSPAPRPVGWIALAAPVVLGLGMAVLVDPRMAVFALLGPVVMIGGRLDERRLRRRERRLAADRLRADMGALVGRLGERRLAELRRHRADHPPVAMLAWWVERHAPRVWERRRNDPDFLTLAIGYGAVRWEPPVTGVGRAARAVTAAVAGAATIGHAPVTVDLRPGMVLGVTGERAAALDLARGLVCAATVLQGPSDLRVAVFTDRPVDWAWVKWLPHTQVVAGDRRRLLAGDEPETTRVLGTVAGGLGAGGHVPVVLVIADRGGLADPGGLAIRRLLAAGAAAEVSGLVVAPTRDDLPVECTTVVESAGYRATLAPGTEVLVGGAVEPAATSLARGLARYRDPDLLDPGRGLPDRVRLLDLLGIGDLTTEELVARWEAAGDRVEAVLGATGAGPLRIDLAADGPHALVAGTTGSGKSELLRSLVASLTLAHDPRRLTFVLVDYKGGSAFDSAARLPHTVGLITDLDGESAERALRCLEAELRHRERELRSGGAADIDELHRRGGRLPRMVIVVDEFAALARELPGFVGSLVDIAARGRSLGIHLVLATQRPAGVVGDAIRANTNLRVALRVTDRADSIDVLGDPAAAAIGRHLPGRALIRTGPGELRAFQAALVSSGQSSGRNRPVVVRPFRFGHEPDADDDDIGTGEPLPDGSATDLDRVVETATRAVARLRLEPPRRPWTPPLPLLVSTDDIGSLFGATDGVTVGLADEPDRQRTVPFTWSPAEGSLALYGAPGSGLSTALETVVLGLAACDTDPVPVYVIERGTRLRGLAELASVGAVIGLGERERLVRLVRMLDADLHRSGATPGDGPAPLSVLVVDGLEAVLRALDGVETAAQRDGLARLLAEGPGQGIVTVYATPRPAGVPAVVEAAVANRLVLNQADPVGAAVLGVRDAVGQPPGRAIHVPSGRRVQIAIAGPGLVAKARRNHRAGNRPPPVGVLPTDVRSVDVEALLAIGPDRWTLPVGVGDHDLEPVGLDVGPGDHIVVVGGGGAGKTTLLAAIAVLIARCEPEVRVVAAGPELGRLVTGDVLTVADSELAGWCADLIGLGHPAVLLVDDADTLPDAGIAELVTGRHPHLHVVVATRPEVKAVSGHWVRAAARSRLGVWLRPSPGIDADLWRTQLPRGLPTVSCPGRGLLVREGITELVQVMRP